jgi:hypothetical protein
VQSERRAFARAAGGALLAFVYRTLGWLDLG